VPPAPPSLLPLPLDGPAIAAAIAACLRTVALVEALADVRASAGVEARAEWRGPARDRFDEDVVRLDADAAWLVAELLRLAASLGGAAEEVMAENRRRADAALARERAQLVAATAGDVPAGTPADAP
jgi:hypothetical protein